MSLISPHCFHPPLYPYHLYPNSPAVIKSYPTLVTINFSPHSLIIFQFPFHTKPFSKFGSQVNSTQLPHYRQFSCVAKTKTYLHTPISMPPLRSVTPLHSPRNFLLSTLIPATLCFALTLPTSLFCSHSPNFFSLLSLSQLLPSTPRLHTSFTGLPISSDPPPCTKPPIRGGHLSCVQPPLHPHTVHNLIPHLFRTTPHPSIGLIGS